MSNLQDIYSEWQNNPAFREAFKKNPLEALKSAGFEVSPEDFDKISALLKEKNGGSGGGNEELDKRISK